VSTLNFSRFIPPLLPLMALLLAGFVHAQPMGRDEARLLLMRTSFAASEGEVDQFSVLSREQAVERLLSWVRLEGTVPPPPWTATYDRPQRENLLTPEAREAYRKEQLGRALELRAWWFAEMLTTPSPLTEKMTLFWHNHFVSAQQKVRIAHLMYRQNQVLRGHALGNFRAMLHAIARDPAMLIYLDTAGSRSEAPNENFAREVMELFTLGEGHYTEHDVKEAARTVTGWAVNRDTGEAVFRPRQHDGGVKTLFGEAGRYDMDAMLDLLLAKPETAEFICAKLWKEFVSPAPDPAEIRRLASVFRGADYEIRPLLKAMLASDAFYAEANRGTLVKSPVDLLVGTLREFRFQINEPAPFVAALRQLGQDLFNPPNVKGWPGGDAWINSSSLLGRKQILERLFRFEQSGPAGTVAMPGAGMAATDPGRIEARRSARAQGGLNGSVEFDSDLWLGGFRASPDGARQMSAALMPLPPVQATAAPPTLAGIRQLVLDPAYQLK
jgi:uncharacterized protein (DUF1800 family)